MKKNKLNKNLTFEIAIIELEELIDKVNNKNISLDELVEVFERGTFLVDYCKNELNNVKKKIFKLTDMQNLEVLK